MPNYYPQEDSQKQDFICTLRQLVNEGTDNDSISYNAAVILAQSHHSNNQCETRLRLALQNGSSQQKSKVRVCGTVDGLIPPEICSIT